MVMPDDAGRLALLKLLEESLSLDSLRCGDLIELGEKSGLGIAFVLTAGEEATGEAGIFFF